MKVPAKNDRRNNNEPAVDEDFTERVLLSMVFDVSALADDVERLKVQVFALARTRGIDPPTG